jgi:hypothetical protein
VLVEGLVVRVEEGAVEVEVAIGVEEVAVRSEGFAGGKEQLLKVNWWLLEVKWE